MKFASLDTIVKGVLLEKGYPLHYYLDFLVYARTCLRELSFDDLKVIKSELLTVNDYNAVDLPCDFVDIVLLGIEVGQKVKPLVTTDTINRLTKKNAAGEIIRYDAEISEDTPPLIYFSGAWQSWNTVRWNDYGENLGRAFGYGAGAQWDTYIVLPERNQIQLNEDITNTQVVIDYISDGMCCDSATKVDSYAQKTIESYIKWQHRENNRTYGIGERQMAEKEYNDQRKILRARKSDITIEKIKRIAQQNYKASTR